MASSTKSRRASSSLSPRPQAWIAATRLSSVFERLLREWILRTSPPQPRLADILAGKGRPCSACGVTYESIAMPPTVTNSTAFSSSVVDPSAGGSGNGGVVAGGGTPGLVMPVPPGTIVCDCCDATYHLECLRPPLREVPRAEWFCPACVSPGLSDGKPVDGGTGRSEEANITLARSPPRGGFGCWSRYTQAAVNVTKREDGPVALEDRGANGRLGGQGGDSGWWGVGDGEPPLLCGSGKGGSLEKGGGEAGCLGMGGMGEWGPSPGVPKALDWSLSRRARECLEVRFFTSSRFFSLCLCYLVQERKWLTVRRHRKLNLAGDTAIFLFE